MGGIDKKTGYGVVASYLGGGKRTKAHRRAWSLHNDCDPDQLNVLHRCDVRRCGNLAHLFLGTQRTNTLDAWMKKRPIATAPGVDHPLAKLNDDAVREIRSKVENTSALAAKYGVDKATIRRVLRGQTWRHVA